MPLRAERHLGAVVLARCVVAARAHACTERHLGSWCPSGMRCEQQTERHLETVVFRLVNPQTCLLRPGKCSWCAWSDTAMVLVTDATVGLAGS